MERRNRGRERLAEILALMDRADRALSAKKAKPKAPRLRLVKPVSRRSK